MRLFLPLGYDGPKSAVELTEDIGRRTGSCIDAEILLLLSDSPTCLEWLLAAMQRAGGFPAVFAAADHLRAFAWQRAQASPQFVDHLSWLSERGYTREDSRQIRYIVETFHNLEPVFAVLAAMVQRLLVSPSRSEAEVRPPVCSSGTRFMSNGPMDFAECVIGVPAIVELERRHPGPLHPFYRAVAVWPDYATRLLDDWEALKQIDGTMSPGAAVCEVADTVAQGLTGGGAASPSDTSPQGGIADLVRNCLDKSCEVIALATAARRAFVKAEVKARNTATRAATCG